MKKIIYILNGPNLNLLGEREPEIYGSESIDDIQKLIEQYAKSKNTEIIFKQTNHEGELIEMIHDARKKSDGLIINPAGYTHTSVAIGDAIKSIDSSVIEIHITNTFARDDFRHVSYITPVAKGLIVGFGLDSYRMAVESVLN